MSSQLVADAQLYVSKALPNGAASTTSDAIDLVNSTSGDFTANCEILISGPALATGVMGDGKTIKYDVITSTSSTLSGPTTIAATVLTQTGAGGAGCSASTARFRLPSNVSRYIGVKATGSTTGDCSGSSFTVKVLF